jgi:hypothetical protein
MLLICTNPFLGYNKKDNVGAVCSTHEMLEKCTSNFRRKSESSLILKRPRIKWVYVKMDVTAKG